MEQHEVVILLLPLTMKQLKDAVDAFAEQYHVTTQIDICGQVALEGGVCYFITDWSRVQSLDLELDLLGLGYTENEDALLWINPTGPGRIRLSSMPEEA